MWIPKKTYPLAEKVIDNKDILALCRWLKAAKRLTMADKTLEFENKWAKWIGAKYAVYCSSGSSANLMMAYAAKLLKQLENNKVVVPSCGWATTVSPFIQLGYEPIMCGADADNFSLDLENLESVLKKDRPSIVVLVQVLGVPAEMEKILALQKRFKFLLIEDACASVGSEYDGRKIGTFGDMSSVSFYYGHQLSTIEGGMVLTDNKQLYDILIMIRSHGWGKDLDAQAKSQLVDKYQISDFHDPFIFFVPGFNLRPTDLGAVLGLEQLKKADKMLNIRKRNHLKYVQNLTTMEFQKWSQKAVPCSISFAAIAQSPKHRMMIVEALDKHHIETRIFSAGNLGLHPFWFERYGKFHNPVSDKLFNRGFFLPNNESLQERDVLFISSVANGVKVE